MQSRIKFHGDGIQIFKEAESSKKKKQREKKKQLNQTKSQSEEAPNSWRINFSSKGYTKRD